MKNIVFTVDKNYDGRKIKDFLIYQLRLSQVIIKKVKYGNVLVNEKIADMRRVLREGDIIKITLPPDDENPFAIPKEVPLEILFEDDYILAVFKPSGMPTHNSMNNPLVSLQNAVLYHFLPEKPTYRAINRLDSDTSGIVVIAKDHVTASLLSYQMKNGDFYKEYVAKVMGKMEKKHDVIDLPIKRETEKSLKRIVASDGKIAKTEYFVTQELNDGTSILKIILHTGRTHQIRVHLSFIGHPLWADFLYGKEIEGQKYLLSANKIEFTHPFTKERIKLEKKIEIC